MRTYSWSSRRDLSWLRITCWCAEWFCSAWNSKFIHSLNIWEFWEISTILYPACEYYYWLRLNSPWICPTRLFSPPVQSWFCCSVSEAGQLDLTVVCNYFITILYKVHKRYNKFIKFNYSLTILYSSALIIYKEVFYTHPLLLSYLRFKTYSFSDVRVMMALLCSLK